MPAYSVIVPKALNRFICILLNRGTYHKGNLASMVATAATRE